MNCRFGRYVKDLDISENLLQSLDSTSLKHVEVRFLQHLNASKNHIFNIDEEAFVGLDKLQTVDLSSNDLTFIHLKTFARNPSLERLSLANNKHLKLSADGFSLHSFNLRVLNLSDCNLTHIPPKIFQGLVNLQELYISHNAIEVLHFVETAGRLTVLDVGHNNLTDLKPDIFTAFPKLSRLNLSYNNLGALDMTVTAQVANVSSHMDLTGNPWVCDCVMYKTVYSWCRNNSVDLELVCSSPQKCNGEFWTVCYKAGCNGNNIDPAHQVEETTAIESNISFSGSGLEKDGNVKTSDSNATQIEEESKKYSDTYIYVCVGLFVLIICVLTALVILLRHFRSHQLIDSGSPANTFLLLRRFPISSRLINRRSH
jgi:hypothetical protein